MAIGSKVYLQVVSHLQSLRVLARSQPQEASPVLTLVAVTLALLLAILEVDLHQSELQVLGLIGDVSAFNPAFMSP
jgi:hypothetical protein